MKREYCTYFDHRYAARGLAMIRSLRRYVTDARVWVLCMDRETEDLFEQIGEPGLKPVSLAQFEAGDQQLQAAKRDGRSRMEYYFTCTASLIRYVLREAPDAEFVTYLDGDMGFFADPEPIYAEAGDASVIIIAHRYASSKRNLLKYGTYNVGWVTFRRSTDGIACLEWWRDRTIEWCFDIVDEENDRFADQRYLNRFPVLFQGVHAVGHLGANLAPWNIENYKIAKANGAVTVDGQPLLFFHFHHLKRLGRRLFLTGHGAYGTVLSRLIREEIYRPYLRELLRAEENVAPHIGEPAVTLLRVAAGAQRQGIVRSYLSLAKAMMRGLTVRIAKTD